MGKITTARQIGAAVRNERLRQGLTQQQLADTAAVSRGLIARLEKGAAMALYPEKLLAVLDALELSLLIEKDNSSASDAMQQTLPSQILGDIKCTTPVSRKNPEITDELQKKLQPHALTGAHRIMAKLAKHPEKAAVLQETMQSSTAKILEQIASATANVDFLKTSSLVAAHEKDAESGDQQ